MPGEPLLRHIRAVTLVENSQILSGLINEPIACARYGASDCPPISSRIATETSKRDAEHKNKAAWMNFRRNQYCFLYPEGRSGSWGREYNPDICFAWPGHVSTAREEEHHIGARATDPSHRLKIAQAERACQTSGRKQALVNSGKYRMGRELSSRRGL